MGGPGRSIGGKNRCAAGEGHGVWNGPVYVPYAGRTLAPGLAAGELHDPVMAFVLTCVLPAPAAYDCLAKKLPYVLLYRYPLTCYWSRYRCRALLLPRPLRYRPPLALGLLRAAGPGGLLCPPPNLLPSGGCSEGLPDEPSWLTPASSKKQKKNKAPITNNDA